MQILLLIVTRPFALSSANERGASPSPFLVYYVPAPPPAVKDTMRWLGSEVLHTRFSFLTRASASRASICGIEEAGRLQRLRCSSAAKLWHSHLRRATDNERRSAHVPHGDTA